MRILHVRTVCGTGGGPDKTVLKGCQYLNRAGHVAEAFYILDRAADTGRLQALAAELGVRMHVAHEDSPVSMSTVLALRAVLRQGRYDVFHSHEYKSNALAQLLRVGRNYGIVATAHGYNRTTLREALYYGLEKLLFRHVDAIITPTRDMFDLLERSGVPADRMCVIPNGIETNGRQPPARATSPEKARLLCLGRLSREKDQANLLRAAAVLIKHGRKLEVTLAGDGPDKENLARLAVELGLNGSVRMPGFVPDILPLLGSSDVLVSPSLTECMPNAVLEAMWAGLPVVATRVGGVGEMIRHGTDGLLCPPGDAEALAAAIEQMLTDPDLAARLAGSARRRLNDEFSFERRMERVVSLYREVVKQRQAQTE